METIIVYLTISIFIYYILMAGWYGLTLLTSFPDIFDSYTEAKYLNAYHILEKGKFLPISVIMPAYNEQSRILNAVYSILQSHYKNVQLIIVNDGSTDNTLELLIKEFDLYEIPPIIKQKIPASHIKHLYKSAKYINLTVIDKEHGLAGNAADANNCGLNAVATPVFISIDSDTVVEPEALTRILFRFLSKQHCVTVGGAIYVLNGNPVVHGRLLKASIPKEVIPAFQSLEYMRAFTYGRAGLNIFDGALCNSGAFTLNETKIVKEIGGYDPTNFAYDAEMTMKLHNVTRIKKYPTKIFFESNAISWTIVPSTLKSYWLQRNKWQRGMFKSVLKYWRIFFNPRFGVTGMIVFPAYVAFDLMGPVVEFISYILFIIVFLMHEFTLSQLMWLIFFAWGYLVVMTIGSFYLNLRTYNKFTRKLILLKATWLVTVEMFGFRQFKAACCFFATIQYFYNRIRGLPL